MIDRNLKKLKEKIMAMANIVQIMLEKSIEGLAQRNLDLLRDVYILEEQANRFELEIEELCTNTIALFQPEAKDLRIVLMIYKINSDLERIADQAVNIAGSGEFLIQRISLKIINDIPKMAEMAISMFKDSIMAFNTEDYQLSKEICIRDNIVDNYNKQVISHLIEDVKSDTDIVERAFHVLRISRNLERAADLTTNIAEEIIFIAKGKVIKHNDLLEEIISDKK